MRGLVGWCLGVVLVLFVTPGCGPRLPEDDLGTVIYDLQQLPGADKPFPIPDGPPDSAPQSKSQPKDVPDNPPGAPSEGESQPENDG